MWVAKGRCGRFWELTLFGGRGEGGCKVFCAILGCKRVQQVLRTHPCSQLDDLCLDEKVPVLGLHRRRVSVHRCAKARVLKLSGNTSTRTVVLVLRLCGNVSTRSVVLVLKLLYRYWPLHWSASANIMISNSLRTKICRSDFQKIKPFDHRQ